MVLNGSGWVFLGSFYTVLKPAVDHYQIRPNLRESVDQVGVLTQVFAKTRLLEASKRGRHVRLVVGVDENCAGVQLFTDVKRFTDVTRENPRSQAVLRVIGPPQHLIHLTSGVDADKGWKQKQRPRTALWALWTTWRKRTNYS